MRKVILQEWMSLDGYASGPNGEVDFFASPELNKGSDDDIFHFMDSIDTILLGSVTYRLFADYWPQASSNTEIIADKLNATPKIVFSKTLDRAPWGRWEEATVVRTSATLEVRKLKQMAGKDLVLWGSISLAQALVREQLIDEYQLRICPVILGKGRLLFPQESDRVGLKLIETKSYDTGLLLVRYQFQTYG